MIFEGFSTENNKLVKTVHTTEDGFAKDIFISHSERLAALGGTSNPDELIPVYFVSLLGAPAEDDEQAGFHNMLYNLREDLIKCPKLLMYTENELKAPTPEELSVFDGINCSSEETLLNGLTGLINIEGDELRTKLAREELPKLIGSGSTEAMLETAKPLLVWLNRCVNSDAYKNNHDEIPILMYYGGITPAAVTFLHLMSRTGIDVLHICSNLSCLTTIKKNNLEGRMQVFELPCSLPVKPYPDKAVKTKLATVAYNASKELDEILYSSNTIFRDFQFSDMQSLTLKTTYDEIDVLWHQPSRYRTGFGASETKVTVPNIFAKISGVKDKDIGEYWESVKWKLSPDTRVIIKSPSYKKYNESQLSVYKPYYNGEQILTDQLMNSPVNKYTYLSDSIQHLIFSKMQEAVDSGFLKLDPAELVPMVIYVGTNLDREVLRLLQKYDFTKDIPKLIVVDVIEDTFSKVECIQLVLYNLLGFDILIYTPTGYRNIETFVSDLAYETHTMNEFVYNAHIPRFKIPDAIPEPKGEGFFSKLFKKGRK